MSSADDSEAFEAWHCTIVEPGDGDDLESNRAMQRWMCSLFEARGPVAADEASAAYRLHMLQIAHINVEVVRGDIERSTALRPTIEIDEYAETVRIAVDRGWSTPAFFSCENPLR